MLPQLRLACASYGELSAARDNVLLVLPGTSNTRHGAAGYVGSERAFDTDRFHVVCVDAIGLGGAVQPADGLGRAFPRYTVRDLVRASMLLVQRGLGLDRAPLAAVAGASMGAFQALEWAIHAPDSIQAAVLLMPAARAGGVMRTATQQMIELIGLDAHWCGGDYRSPPAAGLRAAGCHYFAWAVTDEYLEHTESRQLAEELEVAGARFTQFDAWNLIRRYQASSTHDVGAPFGGDIAAALQRVRARVLVLPCRQDRLLGVETARTIAEGVGDAEYVEVDSTLGHLAWRPRDGSAQTAFITRHVRSFLQH